MEYKEITTEQKRAITRARKALENLADKGLLVVMMDGTPQVFLKEDYDEANETGTIDCGFSGVRDENGAQFESFGQLSNIIH